jgi:4-diphosphocytidyl-2-C-methyl-D-erythritol kinase
MPEPLVRSAPAKVNLFLRVLAPERSGLHGIETLFCRLGLADTLTAVASGQPGSVTLEIDGPDLGPVEENLAYRAAMMVISATERRLGVHLKLTKRIPVAAGLGGGSADAAATLDLVNQLSGNPVPRSELLHFASRLGADVPFLLSGASLALGWGHGDRMLRLPALPPAPVLLVVPPVGIRTVDGYRWIDEARAAVSSRGALALDLESVSRWSDVARMAGNDFESVVFAREPRIREAFESLVRTGPILCRMSGSGSALFAVYRSDRDRDDARSTLGKKLGTVWSTETT